MSDTPIEQTERAIELEKIAKGMNRPDAANLYSNLARIMGECQMNAALAAMHGDLQAQRNSVPSVDRVSQWIDYFARKEQEYR